MSLAHKMSLVAQECHYVQKDGTNSFHRYKYATAAAVLEKVNDALAKYRICATVRPEIIDTHEVTTASGKAERIITVRTEITLHDGDSDQTLTTAGLGSGQDAGDKAVMKALTASAKYSWMLALNISTGDDPEADDDTDKRSHAPPAQQRQQQAAPRPAAPTINRDPDLMRGAVTGAVPAQQDPMAALWGKVDTAVRMLQAAGIKSFQAPARGSDQVTLETFLADARGALANAKAAAK